MQNYALIKNGRVDNVIVADADFVASIAADWDHIERIVSGASAGIGWGWDGSAFVAHEMDPPEAADPVPHSCSRRQGRLALLALGVLDAAESAIASIADETERKAAQIEYEADTWERSNPFVQQLWAQLGGSPQSLDDAFSLAVTL